VTTPVPSVPFLATNKFYRNWQVKSHARTKPPASPKAPWKPQEFFTEKTMDPIGKFLRGLSRPMPPIFFPGNLERPAFKGIEKTSMGSPKASYFPGSGLKPWGNLEISLL